jgi:2-(1,2-epoxy-1,2-dihydrophenyl)acetyl-CoA isomerase
MSETVLVRREGAVSVLTLNRPDRLNSFTVEMHEALATAFDAALADPAVRAIVLTGAGRGFCAGQDLQDRSVAPGAAKNDLGESLEHRYNPLVRRMRASPKPVVVAVNGVAAGAGANLALHGDIVLAAASAKFMQAFVKIGLMPDSGGTWLLARALGEARAKALCLLGEPLGAEEAARAGLIHRCCDDAALMAEALRIAAQLAAGPPLAIAAIKQAVHDAAENTLDRHLEMERDGQRRLGFTDDYAEGVGAFMAKRQPAFAGR